MNKLPSERLYNLLPSIYRLRDASEGEPLRTLLAVIENELQAIEEDIDGLYDNWFIETCDEWVVPYIADLLGVRNLHPISSGNFSMRPYVANTLAYRRRKGTASVLEQLARDVTGWPARAVEYFQLLSVTQHLNHVMLSRGQILNLRNMNDLELLGSPFEHAAYTGEVRRIANNRGKYNISNIGLFLWRLQPYAVTHTTARLVSHRFDGLYTFDPLGYDIPLFNMPQRENDIPHIAEEINVPGMLRRLPLYEELEALRQSLADKDREHPKIVYFGSQPIFEIFINKFLFNWDKIPGNDNVRLIEFLTQKFGLDWIETARIEKIDNGRIIRVINEPNFLSLRLNDEKTKVDLEIDDGRTGEFNAKMENDRLNIYINENVPPEQILICDLSVSPPAGIDWQHPPNTKQYTYFDKDGKKIEKPLPITAAVDPKLGRMAFSTTNMPISVEVSYTYGFSGDVGGGPYNRQISVDKWYDLNDRNKPVTWQKGITKGNKTLSEAPDPDQLVQTFQEAIKAWINHAKETPLAFGIIAIMDSRTYIGDLTLEIPEGCRLSIVAADWPASETVDQPEMKQRIVGQFTPDGLRPLLQGKLCAKGIPAGYLFSWDNIPGSDNKRLIEFLHRHYCIEWVKIETARIEKTNDDKTIRVSTEKNSLSLRLNNEKTKVILEIDEGVTEELIVKKENSQLNIYPINLDSGELVLDGLLIEGGLTVLPGDLGKLCIAHCSLVPEKGGLRVESEQPLETNQKNDQLSIHIDRSICGPIYLSDTVPELYIIDSIIDHSDVIAEAITAPGANTNIESSTIFGGSTTRILTASNSIFTKSIKVERKQIGCMRFSYVPESSQTPRRYRCQPDLEIAIQIEKAEKDAEKNNTKLDQARHSSIRAEILDWLVPVFTSSKYGHPAYGQLHMTCPKQIETGAEDGSEMGVFRHLQHPQREANLRACLDEYLRFGLEAGIFYVNYENRKEEL